MYAGLEGFLQPFVSLSLIWWIGVGTFVGLYVGAIPGLSVTMAVSLLISFTFTWDVLPALAIYVRAALGDDAANPQVIGTVRGVGYKFLKKPSS